MHNKKRGKFWSDKQVQGLSVAPESLYVKNRGGKGQIMQYGVFHGMDGQAVHWNMSGWMNYRKAHDTLNEYIREHFADHAPVSEV
jgi:hypothetical protein